MELLRIDCLGKPLRLVGALAGWQQLFWDEQLVSQKNASAENEGVFTHRFSMLAKADGANENKTELEQAITVEFEVDVHWEPFSLAYRLILNQEVVDAGTRTTQEISRQVPSVTGEFKQNTSKIGLMSLAFKLLKSAKVIKVILAGATLAAYSYLFSFQFAIALIACLVIHEWGHIRAMKYFGMKTKGIYLIPFFGGLALSEDKINTRWQDVVISIMGPSFGLLLCLGFIGAFWLTGNPFFAGLATFNAFINLFNLLPIVPLDGGHIVKSICFSSSTRFSFALMIAASALGIYACYRLQLYFMVFFLSVGSVEILMEWRYRKLSLLLPLDRYGQIFSALWYVATIAALILVIWYCAATGDTVLGMPLRILQN